MTISIIFLAIFLQDGPAFQAGIRVGDVLKVWNGRNVTSKQAFSRAVMASGVGIPVKVELERARGNRVDSLTFMVCTVRVRYQHFICNMRLIKRTAVTNNIKHFNNTCRILNEEKPWIYRVSALPYQITLTLRIAYQKKVSQKAIFSAGKQLFVPSKPF